MLYRLLSASICDKALPELLNGASRHRRPTRALGTSSGSLMPLRVSGLVRNKIWALTCS
jgi:hypothetical protein